jgi:hypothetical protein
MEMNGYSMIPQTGEWIGNYVGRSTDRTVATRKIPIWNRIPNLHSVSIYFGQRTEKYVSSDTISKN